MEIEEISRIEIMDSGEIYVALLGGGKPMYQYVYRAAAGVYWDNDAKGFKALMSGEWNQTNWFNHIVRIVASELGIALRLTETTTWVNVPEQIKEKIFVNWTVLSDSIFR